MSNDYSFKKISDVDVIQSIDDSAHVLVENAGVLKRIAANRFGTSGGGSGGGVTSWNDLTDKPFYEEISVETYADSLEVEVASAGEPVMLPVAFDIQEESVYAVTIDETEYRCKAYMSSEVGIPVIGNGALAGLAETGNNEPFMIATLNAMTMMCMSEVGSHTVSIVAEISNVKTLDQKYISVLDASKIPEEFKKIDWDNYKKSSDKPVIINRPITRYLSATYAMPEDITECEMVETAYVGKYGNYCFCKVSDNTQFSYVDYLGQEGMMYSLNEHFLATTYFKNTTYPGITYTKDIHSYQIVGIDVSGDSLYARGMCNDAYIFKAGLSEAEFLYVPEACTIEGYNFNPGVYLRCQMANGAVTEKAVSCELYYYDGVIRSVQLGERVFVPHLYASGIFIRSSRIGSNKCFKIMVDDDGNISATAIN